MIMIKALKYLILENCLEVFFERLKTNISVPSEETFTLLEKIYRIIKQVRDDQGINIGSFDDFCKEELMMVSYTVDPIGRLKLQLLNLQIKYPIYA